MAPSAARGETAAKAAGVRALMEATAELRFFADMRALHGEAWPAMHRDLCMRVRTTSERCTPPADRQTPPLTRGRRRSLPAYWLSPPPSTASAAAERLRLRACG